MKTHPVNLPIDFLRSLSRECAFPVPVDHVTVRQTHISTVFLGDDVVYKVKKPVKLPFLDFSTIEQRHFFCHEEVRVNRPWAPDVYLGVVPVTREAHGLRFEGSGPVVDWAVKMRRLPESANLRSRLTHGLLEPRDLARAAQRIAAIHRQACCCVGEQATQAEAEFRRRLRENWEFAHSLKPHVIEPQVLQRLESLSGDWLQRHDETLRRRATDGHIRDLHGDLRLEHIFLFPDRSPPNDIVILDGIEFDPGLRRIDVVADVAFAAMELSFAGRRDLARDFAEVYFSETQDHDGRGLLPLFAAYRSAVRAKVAAILGSEPEIPHPDRGQALERSQAHWLWCLSELERPERRPALLLVSGLPGTGKSTLAKSLSETAHFDEVLRSDVIRKRARGTANDVAWSDRIVFRRHHGADLRRMLVSCSQAAARRGSGDRGCHLSARFVSSPISATGARLWGASHLAGMCGSAGNRTPAIAGAARRSLRR